MGLVDRAGPGREEEADQVAEAACELADAAPGSGWSAAAADDALVAIDTWLPHSPRSPRTSARRWLG
ncbi:hypothetical protein [Streptomyces sp. NPDC058583]|uniref:hypothetical protein n=1 Tax=unclassified Streptomyces TaxID=2593676 RepID=UPI00364EB795